MQERIIQSEGVVKAGHRRSIPAALISAAIRAYKSGEKANQIEVRLGLANPTLFYHLRVRGVPLQGRGEWACKWCKEKTCHARKKFCSTECRAKYQQSVARENGSMPECLGCGAEMWKSQRWYCTEGCKRAHKEDLLQAQLKRYAQMREDYFPVKTIIAEMGISRPRSVKLRELWLAGRHA